MKTILVTGGAGYIGSHTCVELLNAGYAVVVADDLVNSKEEALRRVKELTGKDFPFYPIDVCDARALDLIFERHPIDAVLHFAGLKAVGESVEKPLAYYRNNLDATLTLLERMRVHDVHCLIFSSSATVYGAPKSVPIPETADVWCTNPYGWTKYMSEQILRDCAAADPRLSTVLLRYFNPVGAHESGLLGEDPRDIPNNLMPYILKVSVGKFPFLHVYGDDYPTPDGTGVRDYIHVQDLARGHVAAIAYALAHTGAEAVNLGTGKGYSVLELVHTFERVNNVRIPYEVEGRRAGDIAMCYAATDKAQRLLGWKAEKDLAQMCASAYRFAVNNPNGYDE